METDGLSYRLFWIVLAMSLAAWPLSAATTETAATQAATTEESDDAASTQPATLPAGGEDDHLLAIRQSLKLPEKEAEAYASAFGRNTDVDEPAMKMILRRIQGLPRLTEDEVRQLDQPGMNSLLTRPQHFALQPVRMNVFVWTVVRLDPGKQITPTAYWNKTHGPIWYYFCYNADARKFEQEPIVILTAMDPNTVFGKPKTIGPNGEMSYQSMQPTQVVGVFYKLYNGKGAKAEAAQDYPVLLCWQIGQGKGGGKALDIKGGVWITVGLLIMIAFLYLRSRAKLIKNRTSPFRPSLPENEEDEAPDEPVDPDLRQAAEQYRKERPQDAPDNTR